MIDIDKKCYIIYNDANPELSYEGWGIVTGYRKGLVRDYYEVTTFQIANQDKEFGLFFPQDCVFPDDPNNTKVVLKKIFKDDINDIASKCLDLIIAETNIPDDNTHNELYDGIVAALDKHFNYPEFNNYN